jgi:ubiquinone/menaquinone biosynthesis C-methylase UbiE
MKNSINEIQEYYDKRIENAKDGISASGQWFPKELTSKMCKEICRKIDIKKNESILEIGSGSDVLGNYLRKNCNEYVGIDISFKMLNHSKNKSNIDKLNLIQTTSHTLPISDNTFDIIVMNSVSMYLKEDFIFEGSMKEIKRVLKKNGKIFIGENVTSNRIYWEYNWFNNLNKLTQLFAKMYIKFRIFLAEKNSKLSGKWKNHYREISKTELQKIFGNQAVILMSDACCYSVRKKFIDTQNIGNRRIDFLIIFKE